MNSPAPIRTIKIRISNGVLSPSPSARCDPLLFAQGGMALFGFSDLGAHLSYSLPNGMTVFGLNENDTLTVYRDIFDDDCYRMHGVTIADGDCILDIGANTGLFILFLNKIGVQARVYAFEPAPATLPALTQN